MAAGLLRFGILLAAGITGLLWIYVAGASVAEALPLAKGVRLGLYGMLVLLLLIVPVLAFAISNTLLNLAAVLAGVAAAIFAYTYFIYLPKPSATVMLLSGTLLVILVGTFLMFGRASGPNCRSSRPGCAC